MALGGRVNHEIFPAARAYVEGLADAYEEAIEILGNDPVAGDDVEPAVIELARRGEHVDVIAARCGLTEHQVAENLIRYVRGLS